MGRVLTALADVLALLRLAAEVRAAWRAGRQGGPAAEPGGAAQLGGQAEAPAPDRPGGVGPGGPAAGA